MELKPPVILELTPELLEVVYLLRDEFIWKHHQKKFYGFQTEASNEIIRVALQGESDEVPIEVSRQSGKTETIVFTIEFLSQYIHPLLAWLGKPLYESWNVVIGAPQKEQAKTDFDRLKDYLDKIKDEYGFHYEESNGTTLKLSNNVTIFCFPVNPTSNIESKTAHLIIGEEMQDIPDTEWEKKVLPMGTSTNAPIVMIGTAGYQLCRFYKAIEGIGKVFKFDCQEIIKQKREAFQKDGNIFHLNYEKYINNRISTLGNDNPQIQTQYFLKWQLEKGMWMTEKRFVSIIADGRDGRPAYGIVNESLELGCIAMLDVAKESDMSFLTIMRQEGYKMVKRRIPQTINREKEDSEFTKEEQDFIRQYKAGNYDPSHKAAMSQKYQAMRSITINDWKEIEVRAPVWRVLKRFMLNGALYQDQWEIIDAWLEHYKVYKFDIDSTGVGDATADYYLKKFNHWNWDTLKKYEQKKIRGIVKPVKFSQQSKHSMYSNWEIAIIEGRYWIPDPATMSPEDRRCHERFRAESLSAIREWKGNLFNVRHVDKSKGESGDIETDDSLDSAALAFHDIEGAPFKLEFVMG